MSRRAIAASTGLGALLLVAVSAAAQGGRVEVQSLALSPSPIVWIGRTRYFRGIDEAMLALSRRLCAQEMERAGAQSFVCGEGVPLFEGEAPGRELAISPFGIDRTEVTRAAYDRCVIRGRCDSPRSYRAPTEADANLPVTGVRAIDAESYCAYVGGRLPSEAEWELAARGRDGRLYPWGHFYDPHLTNHGMIVGGVAAELAVDPSDGFRLAAPVGSFPDGASPYGVLDMAGNAREWTRDGYQHEAYASASSVDPVVSAENGMRAVRGGSWRSPAILLRVTAREPMPASGSANDLGFRCAYQRP